MRKSTCLAYLALAGTAFAIPINDYFHGKRQGISRAPPLPDVPSYYFSIPIDHFTSSDNRTYSNRYYVNDTYYRPGGPVIFQDNGEGGFDKTAAAVSLAEYNGSASASMRLAAKLGGLVVGWEHRYYGDSQPFDVNEAAGIPVSGAAGYKYLTIEQALEDIVYFANRFNTTSLENNVNVQSTANLDPYHTPWIFVGGSYAGARAAWVRQRNPEIFYAAWASSAAVEVMMDGSAYWNPVSKSLPSNCTKDLQAMSSYVDQVLSDNDTNSIRYLQTAIFLMQPINVHYDITAAYCLDPVTITNIMLNGIIGSGFQLLRPSQTTQIFCDYLQSFDMDAYLSAKDEMPDDANDYDLVSLAFQNRGHATPTSEGIVTSIEADSNGAELGLTAFAWAFYNYRNYLARQSNDHLQSILPITSTRQKVDSNSWIWQTFTETGWFQATHPGDVQFLASKYLTVQTIQELGKSQFPSFHPSTFPPSPNTDYPNSFGGWTMNPSNTMFTDGSIDPWRSFSVHTEEVDGPHRNATALVPKCNTPPPDTDVFGIIYPGAVHTEDMHIPSNYQRASEEDPQPLYQGLDLFTRAWAEWAPCFNQFRDELRNDRDASELVSIAQSAPLSKSPLHNHSAAGSESGYVWSMVGIAFMLMFVVQHMVLVWLLPFLRACVRPRQLICL